MKKQIHPIHPICDEFIGHVEMTIKMNQICATENSAHLSEFICSNTFDGTYWESELFWMVAKFMIDQKGYGKNEIIEALDIVAKHIKEA